MVGRAFSLENARTSVQDENCSRSFARPVDHSSTLIPAALMTGAHFSISDFKCTPELLGRGADRDQTLLLEPGPDRGFGEHGDDVGMHLLV